MSASLEVRSRCPSFGCRRTLLPAMLQPLWCPLPETLPLPSARRRQRRQVMFRPRRFSLPRRLAPPQSFRACCIPKPNRVRCVSRVRHYHPQSTSEDANHACQCAAVRTALFTPLEEVPPPAAVLRRRNRCPLVVGPPSCPSHTRHDFSTMTLDFKALLHCRVRSAPHRCR